MSGEPTPSRSDEQWIQDYVSGRLSNADAEQFEARCLADDELGAELERAIEIRAVLKGHGTKTEIRTRPRRALLPLAIAASAAILAFGLYWLQRQPEPTPVFRGAQPLMELKVDIEDGELSARWNSIAGAAGYEVQVLASDGELMRSIAVDLPTASVDLRETAKAAFVEVVALDDFGQTLVRSQRIALQEANGSRN
jgi:hypothetical protein